MNKVKLVLDISTNRVVYYTEDYDVELSLEDSVITFDYTKSLPSDMTLSNCWLYRLQGHTLKKADSYYDGIRYSEFEFNKIQFIRYVHKHLDGIKQNIMLDFKYSEYRYKETTGEGINNLILSNYANQQGISLEQAIHQTREQHHKTSLVLRNIEFLREQYITRANIIKNNEQLMHIKDQFAARKNFITLNRPEYGSLIEVSMTIDDQLSLNFKNYLVNYASNSELVNFVEEFAKERNSSVINVEFLTLGPYGISKSSNRLSDELLNCDRYHLSLNNDYMIVVDDDSTLRINDNKIIWFDNKLPYYLLNMIAKETVILSFDIQPIDPSYLKSKYGLFKYAT